MNVSQLYVRGGLGDVERLKQKRKGGSPKERKDGPKVRVDGPK
jgi:hypothetical protein